jgi:hypothetical protein
MSRVMKHGGEGIIDPDRFPVGHPAEQRQGLVDVFFRIQGDLGMSCAASFFAVPPPFVLRTCPFVPSADGRVHKTSAVIAAGA